MLCINPYVINKPITCFNSFTAQFTDDCKISHHLIAQGKIMISITYLREKIDHMIRKHKNYK